MCPFAALLFYVVCRSLKLWSRESNCYDIDPRSGVVTYGLRSGVVSSGQQTSRERQRECVTSPTIIIILQQPAAGITTVTILNLPVSGAYTQLERRDL